MTVAREEITPEYLANIHPGTHLREDYFPHMGVTEYRLAKLLGITQSHLADLFAGRRNITANLALRLGRLFNQSPEMWLGLQYQYDMAKALLDYGADIERVQPFQWPNEDSEPSRLAA